MPGVAGAALAGAATVDPGLVPFGSSIEAKSPPAGVAEARDAGEAGAGGVTEPPDGAAGAALAVAVGSGARARLSAAPMTSPPDACAVSIRLASPSICACIVVGPAPAPVAELAEADPPAGAAGWAGAGGAGGVAGELAALISAVRAVEMSAMRPPFVGAMESAMRLLVSRAAEVPMLPSVATARPRPDAPCAPASPR